MLLFLNAARLNITFTEYLKGCPTERAEIIPIYLIRVMPAEEEKA